MSLMINAKKFFKFVFFIGILIYFIAYLRLQLYNPRESVDLNNQIKIIDCDLLSQNKFDYICIRYNNNIYLPFQFLSNKFDVI